MDTLILFLILGENAFSFWSLRIMFAVGLSYVAFTMLRYIPSMTIFLRVLIINQWWILSKAFSASMEIIIGFLFFNLIIWYITLIDLHNWRILASLEKTQLDQGVWVFWCVAEFCLLKFFENFCIYVHQWYWLIVFFFCVVFVWFWYLGDGDFTEWVWKCFFLWRSFRKIESSSYLNV